MASRDNVVIFATGPATVCYLAESMYGAGLPMAQRIMIGRLSNIAGMKNAAKRLCGIERGEN